MERPEIITVLRQGHDEVLQLRRRVAELEPKAHAYDTMAILARLSVHEQPQGYGIDTLWLLKDTVDKLVAEREAERATAETPDANA